MLEFEHVYEDNIDFVGSIIEIDIKSIIRKIRFINKEFLKVMELNEAQTNAEKEAAINSKGFENQYHTDEYIFSMVNNNDYYLCVSLARLGMLIPFVESTYKRIFHEFIEIENIKLIKPNYNINLDKGTYMENGKTYNGIFRVIKFCFKKFNCENKNSAIFLRDLELIYKIRNNSFHHGVSWPLKKVNTFEKLIKNDQDVLLKLGFNSCDNIKSVYYIQNHFFEEIIKGFELSLEELGKKLYELTNSIEKSDDYLYESYDD